MKVKNNRELFLKLNEFKIIIFDLDNTIYLQKHYDIEGLKKVSSFLQHNIKIRKENILKSLIKLKIKKNEKNIFNLFLDKQKLEDKKYKFLLKNSIKIFQSFRCVNLRKVKSLKNLIKSISKNKILFLVTNGNVVRQKNKIHYLSINKYFKKIYVLDGKKKYLKPSIKSVKSLKKNIKNIGNDKCVYVGDDIAIDGKFALNLKIFFLHYKFRE